MKNNSANAKKTKPIQLLILLCFLCSGLKSAAQVKQDSKYRPTDYLPQAVFVEYQFAKVSMLKSGLEFCFNKYNANKFFIGAGYGLAIPKGKVIGFPNAHLSYNQKGGLMTKVGITNHSVSVTGGITFLNLLDLGLGYSIPYQKSQTLQIKGITVGLSARLFGDNDIYTKLKFF